MKNCLHYAVLCILLLSSVNIQAQLKIKDGSIPSTPNLPAGNAVFELESNQKGFLPPRMDSAHRNTINTPTDGMVIYNTDEGCINMWNAQDAAWKSLCGSQPMAKLTVSCGSVVVNGVYTQGVPCGSSHFLQIPVTVNTPGNFTIIATSKDNNGYSFTYSGIAAQQGTILVSVPAQGTPANIGTDTLQIKINNASAGECDSVAINVGSPAASYTITSCGQSNFRGGYVAGTAVTPANTDTVFVNVTNISNGQNSWSITTNTVDGLSFSGGGSFNYTGPQYVILSAQGTPANSQNKVFTYITNSPTQTTPCQTTLRMTLHSMNILYNNGGWDIFSHSPNAQGMINNQALFGNNNRVVQPVQNINLLTPFNADGNLTTLLAAKPDIVVLSYSQYFTLTNTQDQTALANYVKAGGVLILAVENTAGLQGFFNQLYGSGSGVTVSPINGTGNGFGTSNNYTYQFVNTAFALDPIVGGSFSTFGASGSGSAFNYWGEDYTGTQCVTNLPATETIYTTNQNSSGNALVNGSATMFRSQQYNLFFVGDGGWTNPAQQNTVANNGTTTNTYNNPLRYTGSGNNLFPAQQAYGWQGTMPLTNNAALFCNVLAWAIQQAQFSGINSANYK